MSRKLRTWAELVALAPSHDGAAVLLRAVRKACRRVTTAAIFLEELRTALEERLEEHAIETAVADIRKAPSYERIRGRGFSMIVIDDPIRTKEDAPPDMH